MIRLAIKCDVRGCEETVVGWEEEERELMLGDARLSEGGLFHFWAETSWIKPPEGWTIDEEGAHCCPAHRAAGSGSTVPS